jgi:hypothetical protein
MKKGQLIRRGWQLVSFKRVFPLLDEKILETLPAAADHRVLPSDHHIGVDVLDDAVDVAFNDGIDDPGSQSPKLFVGRIFRSTGRGDGKNGKQQRHDFCIGLSWYEIKVP